MTSQTDRSPTPIPPSTASRTTSLLLVDKMLCGRIATTPSGRGQPASTQALINAAVSAFNTVLSNGLGAEAKVVLVDVFAVSHDQATNPGPYGLTNVSETACDLNPAKNPLGSSLTCNGSNLKAGDVSHYSFADDVHPSPFNNLLLARYVSKALVTKGWL